MANFYTLSNPKKYIGDKSHIVHRSSWEKKFMRFLDVSPRIRKWASEEIAIPYFLTLDKKWHRYFPDFYIELETGDKFIVEIKPFTQRVFKEQRKGNQFQALKFIQNQTKWKFATSFAKENGLTFLVFDEYDLRQLGLSIPVSSTTVPQQKILYEKHSPFGQSVNLFIQPLLKHLSLNNQS